ncbi:MAG: hypothetical protein KGL10_08820 [Alphaproteobacteria bacterium]|nr:hypothetical protein [Alphaproteobacteria bacterium]
MTKKSNILAVLVLSALLLLPRAALPAAMGNLTITPWRIVFGARDRSGAVTLLNTSNQAATYRIGWMLTQATAQGKYVQIPYDREKDKNPFSVPNMIIYSPRQVTIEPHGYQLIRLALRRPSNLPFGEYRAHMTFIRMAHQTPPSRDPNAKNISMELNVNFGFSIPVIVRQGVDENLKVELQNPKLVAQGNYSALEIDLTRVAGTFSSYGTIEAYWTPPGGKEKKVGELTNVALYPELKTRHLKVPLFFADGRIAGGAMRVVYVGKLDAAGKIWDQKSFGVGGGR